MVIYDTLPLEVEGNLHPGWQWEAGNTVSHDTVAVRPQGSSIVTQKKHAKVS